MVLSKTFLNFALQSLDCRHIWKAFRFSAMVNLDNSTCDARISKNALPKCRICILTYTTLGVSCFFLSASKASPEPTIGIVKLAHTFLYVFNLKVNAINKVSMSLRRREIYYGRTKKTGY